MPDDAAIAPPKQTVRAKHAASLIVLRIVDGEPHMLMGMRGAKHRFMPNRLVFPGGRVDRADLTAPHATPLSAETERALRKKTNARLGWQAQGDKAVCHLCRAQFKFGIAGLATVAPQCHGIWLTLGPQGQNVV